MDANMDMALQALENGDHHTARALPQVILQEDPDNELAWLSLAEVVETDEEREACLQQAHRISGRHDSAQRGAGLLGARAQVGVPSAQAAAPEPTSLDHDPVPDNVPVSHSVRVTAAQPTDEAPAVMPAGPPTPPAAPGAGGRPGWVQWGVGLGVVLLIIVLIVVFILVAVFLLRSAGVGVPLAPVHASSPGGDWPSIRRSSSGPTLRVFRNP